MQTANDIIREHDAQIRSLAAWVSRACVVPVGDLEQEGRLALFLTLPRFDAARGVRLWTYARPFVLGAMYRCVRRDRRHVRGDVDVAEIAAVGTSAELQLIARQTLLAALGAMNGRDLAVVVMHFNDELDYRAIARALGISLGTVCNRMRRAMSAGEARAA